MQKNVQITLSIALLFLGILKSVAQETNRGGGGFTIDGIVYEVLSFNPNEVSVFNATVTDEVIIPAIVTFQDVAYNVITIGSNSFEGNTGLTSVTIPGTVESISFSAFSNTGLTEVIALGTVPPTIQANTFENRSTIALTVPDDSEDDYLSNGWTGFATINGTNLNFEVNNITYSLNSLIVNTVSVTESSITGSGLTIPSSVMFNSTNYTVTEIAAGALENNQLTSVSLPSTLTKIGSFAFRNNQLTSVIIPNAVTEIPLSTFRDNQLETVTLPNTMTSIGENAFRNNQLTSVTIPTGITKIDRNVFRDNNLSSITIPDGVTEIDIFAFYENNLTTITIPASVTNIGSFAFSNSPLDEVISLATTPPIISNPDFIFGDFETTGSIDLTVPTGTETAYANAGWVGFASVNGVVNIAVGAIFTENDFEYEITSLSPNEVEIIGATNVPQNLVLPNDTNFQGELFTITGIGNNGVFENLQITSVVLPTNLRSIGSAAFKNNLITEVSLPESVEFIATQAFRVNQISTVIIPPNVTNIEAFAFSDGNPVTTVICEGLVPSSVASSGAANTFANRPEIDLYIPAGTAQAYTDATWTGFKSVNEASKALALKVYLQGASLNPNVGEEDLMRDDLREAGLLPFISPYGDGLAIFDTLSVNVTTGRDAIVDWIFIELRSATNPTTIIESRSALLQRDGDVVAMDAISPIQFTSQLDDYFITIKHRNHLGITMANAKQLSSVITVIDFANAINPITFGSNAQTDAGMPANTLGMWSGNTNGDSIIQYSGTNPDAPIILSFVLNDPGNFLNFSTFIVNEYDTNDINLDGNIQYVGVSPDAPFILQNVLAHPGNFLNFSTFQIQEQLPEN